MNYMNSLNDQYQDSQLNYNFSEQLRLGYIRKVYGILSTQLLFTVLFTVWGMNSVPLQEFQKRHVEVLLLCLFLTFILPFIIVCFQSSMRKVPYNYITLLVFTIAESYLISYICDTSNRGIVFMATFMTFGLVVSLMLYAMTTKTDFTTQGGMLFVFFCALILFFIFYITTQNKIHIRI